jgi:arylsulfatase A-like enzyme
MPSHSLIKAIALLLIIGPTVPDSWAADKPDRKPNILFLFTDDQRADTIAALGNSIIQTPNIDALVKRGFVFKNAYCMGSSVGAVCTPSRNMLLSGKAYFRFGSIAPPTKPNFPTSMKQAGYVTYHHGKRGNTAPAIQEQFDHNKYENESLNRKNGEAGKQIVDEAIDFLQASKRDKPFFMYLAFGIPHDPRVASQKFLDLYDEEAMPLPKNFMPKHPFDNGELMVRDEKLAAFPRPEMEIRKHLRDYYAIITALDEQIGRLITNLKERDLYENTIIIFSSDHGLAIGSHGLMGKQNLYEHSMKSPLIFAGPGIPQGQTEAFTYLFDIFPTVCELSGAAIPEGIDGISQLPVIQGKVRATRDVIFTAYKDVQRAVRKGDWKLLRYPSADKTQLFNLSDDPHEINNLAADPNHEKEMHMLLLEMKRQQNLFGDKPDRTNRPNP